jgi:spermidine synthase
MNVFTNLKLPQVIYETDSKYNGHVQVVQVGEVRKIKVDKIDQSISFNAPSCTRLVWGKTVELLKEVEPDLKNVLIMGMAGGTMAHLFSRAFPGIQITSVELDPTMVDIARKFFDIDSIPNHKVINDDALRVVVEPEKFDITEYMFQAIVVDIFIGEKFPDLGKSGNFISALKKLAQGGGLIVFNRIYIESHQDDVNVFIDYVSQFLHDVKCLVVAGYTNSDNVLIYGRV